MRRSSNDGEDASGGMAFTQIDNNRKWQNITHARE